VEQLEFGHRESMTSFLPVGKAAALGKNRGFVASRAGSYPLKIAKSPYFIVENFPKALGAYDTARQKVPGYHAACYGKARSHLMLGQKAEAKGACRDYLAAAKADDSLVPAVKKMLALCD
jgi:hypothetical protein